MRDWVDIQTSQWPLAVASIGSATLLGLAIHISNGGFSPGALASMTAALALASAAVISSGARPHWFPDPGTATVRRMMKVSVGAALVFQFILLASAPIALYFVVRQPTAEWIFRAAIVIAGILSIGTVVTTGQRRWMCFAGCVVIFIILAVAVVASGPNGEFDVWMFQHNAAVALLHGHNPYSISYPDLYPGRTGLYAPELSRNGVLTFGLPYPPLSLLLVLPGQALAGDIRYAEIVALAGAAVLIALAVRGTLGPPAALLFLFTPRIFLVVRQAWTESLVVFAFAALVFAASRGPRWIPAALGAMLAVKQYGFLIVPSVWRLSRAYSADWRPPTRIVLGGVVLAAAITLPFAIWDLDAFFRSVIAVQVQQPFRRDALSYLVAVTRPGDGAPLWVLPVAVSAAYVLVLRHVPRTPAGLAAGAGLVFFTFFAFNKQAFANYYFLVIAMMASSAALSELPGRNEGKIRGHS